MILALPAELVKGYVAFGWYVPAEPRRSRGLGATVTITQDLERISCCNPPLSATVPCQEFFPFFWPSGINGSRPSPFSFCKSPALAGYGTFDPGPCSVPPRIARVYECPSMARSRRASTNSSAKTARNNNLRQPCQVVNQQILSFHLRARLSRRQR